MRLHDIVGHYLSCSLKCGFGDPNVHIGGISQIGVEISQGLCDHIRVRVPSLADEPMNKRPHLGVLQHMDTMGSWQAGHNIVDVGSHVRRDLRRRLRPIAAGVEHWLR